MLTKDMITDLPALPGVYFFRGASGDLLYIGKAKSLNKRVRSYLYDSRRTRKRKMKRLVRQIRQIDYETCGSELEALLLESRLIKEHQPPYNTSLKFVGSVPFIRISLNEDFPKVELVFETAVDGAKYFGPFYSLKWTREVVELLHRIFPLRMCEGEISPNPDFRPCFSYHLNRCDAPCAARVSRRTYRALVDDVIRLLDGEHHMVIEELVFQRDQAAAELRFERAARLQSRIEQIEKVFLYLDVHRNSTGK